MRFTPIAIFAVLCATLVGCTTSLISKDAKIIAANVSVGSSVTLPAGTTDVYVIQHGTFSATTEKIHFPTPTTQPQPFTISRLLMILMNDKHPVDIYATMAKSDNSN